MYLLFFFFFFFNDTATTEIYTLSLHDALPISCSSITPAGRTSSARRSIPRCSFPVCSSDIPFSGSSSSNCCSRSEEHTSELQSPCNLVCRLLLEKKKKKQIHTYHTSPHTQVIV